MLLRVVFHFISCLTFNLGVSPPLPKTKFCVFWITRMTEANFRIFIWNWMITFSFSLNTFWDLRVTVMVLKTAFVICKEFTMHIFFFAVAKICSAISWTRGMVDEVVRSGWVKGGSPKIFGGAVRPWVKDLPNLRLNSLIFYTLNQNWSKE